MAIDTQHPDYRRWLPEWQRMRNVLAGQSSMRLAAEEYLRRPMGMTDDTEWKRYVEATPFFEASTRTLEGLAGLAFYRDPQFDLPESMKPFLADATGDGVPFQQFVEKVFEEVLAVARVGVMVEMPVADPTIRTLRDQERSGRRPFLRRYNAETVFNWATSEVNGSIQLTEVRLAEIETEKVGEWDTRHRRRIRVLQLDKLVNNVTVQPTVSWQYRQRIFVHKDWINDEDGVVEGSAVTGAPAQTTTVEAAAAWSELDPIVPKMDGNALAYIPFWIINPSDQSADVVRPPLLGLANININHFNTSAALENALFWSGNPQPYIAGLDPDGAETFTVGSSEAWIFKDANTKVDFLSFSADGLASLEKRLDRLEQHMAILGAKMLSPDKAGVEAAETARIHRQGEISVLASICGSVSRSMTDVAAVATKWDGKDSANVLVKIFTAFYDQTISAEDALSYMKLWQAGVIDIHDLLALLKKGQIVEGSKTIEDIAANNQSSPVQPIMAGLTSGTGTTVPPRAPTAPPAPRAPTPPPAPAA